MSRRVWTKDASNVRNGPEWLSGHMRSWENQFERRKDMTDAKAIARTGKSGKPRSGLASFVRRTGPALLTVAMLVLITACASSKAGMSSPELPARHWLDEAPGIPIENKEKYDAAIPNLYNPDKKFGFEDCVYLTIQQSPSLVNSAVDIEIKRLDQTTAVWKYIPEPHMTVQVSQNLTNFNKDAHDVPGEYGRTQFEIGFYAQFPNPVATYFEIKAQAMLTGIAISTHRKAVGEAIYKIAEAYLRLQAQQHVLQAQRSLIPVARELTEYWKQVESVEGNQGSAVSLAQQHEREAELGLEKAETEELMQRTNLKVLAGLDPYQQFQVDASNASEILKGFDGHALRWDERWAESEDSLLLRTQIKLADYKIMLAWAEYVPNMTISVNMNPPRGQAQPESGTADQFLHLTFDFPLIDWGRRYRGVQSARMVKAQAFHSMAEKRFDYQNKWIMAEQNVSLALTNLKLAHNRYKTAQMQYDEARISFENGLETLPNVANRQEAMVQAQLNYINTELDYRLAQLEWMHVSGLLQKRFLGLPDRELDKLVGGSTMASAGVPGAQPPLAPEDEKVFPAQPVKEDRRPIGRPSQLELGKLPELNDSAKPQAAAAGTDTADLNTVPTLAGK